MVSIRSGEALLGWDHERGRAGRASVEKGGWDHLGQAAVTSCFAFAGLVPSSSAVRAGAHLPLGTVHGLVPTFRASLAESNFLQPLILQRIQYGWYFLGLDL